VSVPLVIQHAMRMRPIILSTVDNPTIPNFFQHYLINDKVLGGGGGNLRNIKYEF
jgi:hypothetical protein